jgi:hypothetical protein
MALADDAAMGALITPSLSAMRAISTIAAADLTAARARSTVFWVES